MQIIAGAAKGRRLVTLAGEATRPTTGKVRAALFNILMAYQEDADWLDLYAGSGAVGLEAASRGARRVVLVESAAPALRVIQQNMAAARLPGVELVARPVEAALGSLAGPFDVVFLDPPYDFDASPVLASVAELGLLRPDGKLVLEHRSSVVPPQVPGLACSRTTRYAESALSFYGVAG